MRRPGLANRPGDSFFIKANQYGDESINMGAN